MPVHGRQTHSPSGGGRGGADSLPMLCAASEHMSPQVWAPHSGRRDGDTRYLEPLLSTSPMWTRPSCGWNHKNQPKPTERALQLRGLLRHREARRLRSRPGASESHLPPTTRPRDGGYESPPPGGGAGTVRQKAGEQRGCRGWGDALAPASAACRAPGWHTTHLRATAGEAGTRWPSRGHWVRGVLLGGWSRGRGCGVRLGAERPGLRADATWGGGQGALAWRPSGN